MQNKELDITEERKEEQNEQAYEQGLARINSYGLFWNHRSIDYILNKENVSFGQLRSSVYIREGEAVFDYTKSVKLILKAGLIGAGIYKAAEDNKLEDKAYEIMDAWREEFGGYVGTLHLLLIKILEEKHFFIGAEDIRIVNHLSSKNLQQDLVKNLVLEDLEEKMKQVQALSSNI